MRLANADGRAVLVLDDTTGADVATASEGKFGPEPDSALRDWDAFLAWASTADLTPDTSLDPETLGCPSPCPRQIFAIGLNYRDHAEEAGLAVPERLPPVFTKFVTSLAGPRTTVVLPPGGNTDWEVELVVVIGREASHVPEHRAWEHVAGLAVGQDLSERVAQLSGPAPQFSFGKSHAGFAPVGPWLVTPDELTDRDDLALSCSIDGHVVQSARTSDLLYPVGRLVSELSGTVRLLPGDLIFTGTPAGVGLTRTPPRFLQPGERLTSRIDGIGELTQVFVAAPRE